LGRKESLGHEACYREKKKVEGGKTPWRGCGAGPKKGFQGDSQVSKEEQHRSSKVVKPSSLRKTMEEDMESTRGRKAYDSAAHQIEVKFARRRERTRRYTGAERFIRAPPIGRYIRGDLGDCEPLCKKKDIGITTKVGTTVLTRIKRIEKAQTKGEY